MNETAVIVAVLVGIALLVALIILAVRRRDTKLAVAAAVLGILILAAPFVV